ncbi:cancer/testis antigen 47A-like [Echinops telfairi]|uniref:Cancer/testis antigen 47A-like n=1 Tax=Echinops telfairi TaxID=9371 RepID=A0AC55DRX0_ECHTE|nr:cancer/testis antigen 47A-like [Echinops telfairi]
MSDTEEQDEAREGLGSPVGAGSEESGEGLVQIAEDLEEALAEAAAQSDPEPSNLEEEDEEEDGEDNEELEDQALRFGPQYFRMANLRFAFLGLFRSLLYRLTHNNYVVLRGSDPFSGHQHQVPRRGPPSLHDLSLLLNEPLDLPSAIESLVVSRPSLSLSFNVPPATLPPMAPELPDLPQTVPTVQAIEATPPTLLGLEAATRGLHIQAATNLGQALEPSKPAEQAATSQEMTQFLHENSDGETQESGGEEDKEDNEKEDKGNKEEEPEGDLDPGEGTSASVRYLWYL